MVRTDKDKMYVAKAFGDMEKNPMRLPNIALYALEIMFQDTGADSMKLKSTNGITFLVFRDGDKVDK